MCNENKSFFGELGVANAELSNAGGDTAGALEKDSYEDEGALSMFSYVLFAMAGLVCFLSLRDPLKHFLRDPGKETWEGLGANNSSNKDTVKGEEPPLPPVALLSEKRYCSQARTVLKRRIRLRNCRVHARGSSLHWVELSLNKVPPIISPITRRTVLVHSLREKQRTNAQQQGLPQRVQMQQ